jgi:hypothetical protein
MEKNKRLDVARCTVCGASLKISESSNIIKCNYCQNQIILKNAIGFAKVELDRSKDLVNYRSNLKKSVGKNSFDQILIASNNIRNLIPEDFTANYYFAYAQQHKNAPSFMYDFLENPPAYTKDEMLDVVDHIKHNSDLRDKRRILAFLEKHLASSTEDYVKEHKARQGKEDNYADIPRDAFVCFSSNDNKITEKVVETLEKDGTTTWVSFRNLRPNDSANYWSNIESAISKASIFLVVSSEASMVSLDVQKEINLAQKYNKKLLEYKIDNSKHTSLFKHAFDGINWIDGFSNNKESLINLKERVYFEKLEIQNQIIDEQDPEATDKLIAQIKARKARNRVIFASTGVISSTLAGLYFLGYLPFVEQWLDFTRPVIELQGETTIFVNQGQAFNEPGAIVTDNLDKDVEFVVSGELNLNQPGTYFLYYNATDKNGNRANERVRNVIVRELDNISPSVNLNGSNEMTIDVNSNFIDPGANAIDNLDLNLKVDVVGSVDTTKIGSYTLSYTSTDSSGNKSNTITRKVNVVDTIAPVISLTGSQTLTINYGETFEDPGTVISDNYDKNIVATVNGIVDTTIPGTYKLNYIAIDSSGNKSEELTREVIVGDGVVYNFNDPYIDKIIMNKSVFDSGEIIYLTVFFKSSEDIQSLNLSILSEEFVRSNSYIYGDDYYINSANDWFQVRGGQSISIKLKALEYTNTKVLRFNRIGLSLNNSINNNLHQVFDESWKNDNPLVKFIIQSKGTIDTIAPEIKSVSYLGPEIYTSQIYELDRLTDQEALKHSFKVDYKDDLSGVKYIRLFFKYSGNTNSSFYNSLGDWERNPILDRSFFKYTDEPNEFREGSVTMEFFATARFKLDYVLDYLEITDINDNKKIYTAQELGINNVFSSRR